MILSNIIVPPSLASAMQNWRNSWKTAVQVLKWKILHISPCKKRRDYKKTRHTVGFDVEKYEIWGERFEIPGISHQAAPELMMSELGTTYPEVPVFKQFCCWCNITEHQDIRRKEYQAVPHPSETMSGLIFRSIASSLANAKNQLGNFYRRIRSRAGGKAAVIALPTRRAEIFFAMVANQTTYNPERVGIDEKYYSKTDYKIQT